ncbi:carboxymuconolactone decarboxylase family protein [Actinokineospora iranica]|uniref:Alkylhydroperoxidase AhpD family core domain-containing protein n=1 Tax=Actinokineospora iranica TaxID=1271860 RepID=A0A1G6KA18_9PSEU|nr:carboxymuconolactone decarboxylase family protein [Actinokineospora iranica]SDC27783.1 alkylhydroperoxidase AhpD family core domain-containing protein [Actinokineospora iranica]
MTFAGHTIETAPEQAKPLIAGVRRKLGFVPEPVARMAESPELLGAFLDNAAVFDRTTLSPVEREVVIMTLATRVRCHYCVAMHSSILDKRSASADLIDGLREGRPLADVRLEALRRFTKAVIETGGDTDTAAFLAAGFTRRNALEVVLGIGAYTMSTFANRLTGAPLDAQFEEHRWDGYQTGRSATG